MRGTVRCAARVEGAGLVALLLTVPLSLGAVMTYVDVEPGTTTRDRVVAALGPPVGGDRVWSEHKSQEGTGPIHVEYRASGDVVERVEVRFVQAISRTALVDALGLEGNSDRRLRDGATLLEWFDAPYHLAFTYLGSSDDRGVVSVGYYSPQLFACRRAVARGVTPGDLCAGFSEAAPDMRPATSPSTTAPSTTAPSTTAPSTTAPSTTAPSATAPPGAPPSGSSRSPGTPTTVAPAASPEPTRPQTSDLAVPPSIKRDPSACYDVYLFADAQERVAQRTRQVVRRQRAMEIRTKAQSGECDLARALAQQYRTQFPEQ